MSVALATRRIGAEAINVARRIHDRDQPAGPGRPRLEQPTLDAQGYDAIEIRLARSYERFVEKEGFTFRSRADAVRLHGVVKSVKGHRIRTTFSPIPDVPVSTFTLTMEGGKKGLIVNSRNLCERKYFSKLNFLAHNGKTFTTKRLRLRVAACGHGTKAKKAKGKSHHKKKAKSHK